MNKNFLITAAFVMAVFAGQAQTQQEAITKSMNERYEAAASDFKKLLSANPNSGELYFYAGDNYLYWGELDSAATMFAKGAQIAPTNPLNYAGLGRLAWMKKDASSNQSNFAKAVEIMSTKSNKVDKNIQQITYLKMAESFINNENKKLDEALNYLTIAQKLNETNPEVFVQLGDYYSEKDGVNLTNALKQYNTAFQLNPKYARTLLREGQLFVKVKNWEEGLNYFNKAIEVDPTFAPAYREKAELLYNAGRYPAAIESYAKYLELNNNCRVQQRYASFIFLTKDYKRAIEEVEKATPCNPNNSIMYRVLGYAYFETGDFQKGLTNINKFFELATANNKPISGTDYVYRGKLLWKTGQDSLGIEQIKLGMQTDTSYKEGNSDIASIYFKMKKYDRAAEYYQKKVDQFGSNASPLDFYYLGQARYFNKEYQASDAAFDKAASKYPDANFWRGRCNSKMDNAEMPVGLAKPYFENFIRKVGADPKNIEANKKNLLETYNYLGFFYYTQKNFECSRAAWNKVVELDPASEKAKVALADKDIAAAIGNCELAPTEVKE
jgi:tetratricopeptide (TPR) repeat protein